MADSPSIHHGIKWVTLSVAIAQAVRFVSTVALARLLVPEIFGLVAMASVVVTLVAVVREVGVGSAFIQREHATDEEEKISADTTFWLSLAVSLPLFATAYVASPLIASFFKAAGLVDVLRVLFIGLVLDGLTATPGAILRRRLEFGRHALIEIVISISAAVVSISLAIIGWGVWSLVLGQLVARFIQLALLFRATRWRPRLRFDKQIALQLMSYGKYLWAFSIVSAISRVLDQLLIGRLLGTASIGVYSMGVNLCKNPANQINSVVMRISFPVLSRMQADRASIAEAFLMTLRHVSLVAFPIGVGLFAVAENFVLSVYGPKWETMVTVVQVLPFYAVSLSVSATTGPVFQAIAKPQVLLYTSIVHQAVLVGLLFALVGFGLQGICVAVLVPSLLSATIAFVLVHRYLPVSVGDLLQPIVRPAASSALMLVAAKVAQSQLAIAGMGTVVQLIVAVIVGGLSYLAATFLLNRANLIEFIANARQVATSEGSVL